MVHSPSLTASAVVFTSRKCTTSCSAEEHQKVQVEYHKGEEKRILYSTGFMASAAVFVVGDWPVVCSASSLDAALLDSNKGRSKTKEHSK